MPEAAILARFIAGRLAVSATGVGVVLGEEREVAVGEAKRRGPIEVERRLAVYQNGGVGGGDVPDNIVTHVVVSARIGDVGQQGRLAAVTTGVDEVCLTLEGEYLQLRHSDRHEHAIHTVEDSIRADDLGSEDRAKPLMKVAFEVHLAVDGRSPVRPVHWHAGVLDSDGLLAVARRTRWAAGKNVIMQLIVDEGDTIHRHIRVEDVLIPQVGINGASRAVLLIEKTVVGLARDWR